ncbi:MAG TPA: dinitrogenase iron-molybdenum cofactor biosynthesis protein [Methanosarcinaceae archaeon]|nr:dinitrogenase iron-molybdenum cofactor biosynthesis protein [Methanosarcinaceae archaeon]
MRVCVPSSLPGGLDAPVSEHFGHCEVFTVIDVEDGKIVKAWPLSNDDEGQEHTCAIPVQRVAGAGVEHMIVGGIGQGPLMGFIQENIKVYSGASGTVEETVKRFIAGTLSNTDSKGACQGGCH